jgi:hypothetical protein
MLEDILLHAPVEEAIFVVDRMAQAIRCHSCKAAHSLPDAQEKRKHLPEIEHIVFIVSFDASEWQDL